MAAYRAVMLVNRLQLLSTWKRIPTQQQIHPRVLTFHWSKVKVDKERDHTSPAAEASEVDKDVEITGMVSLRDTIQEYLMWEQYLHQTPQNSMFCTPSAQISLPQPLIRRLTNSVRGLLTQD